MNVRDYLDRIHVAHPCEPSAAWLDTLHLAHMRRVPFENLDIARGVPITLSLPAIYDKVVRRNRGGFCYELNGLFGWLLAKQGFNVTLLSGRVYARDALGPEFDHMLLLVRLDDEDWIADVGFGDSFTRPFPVEASEHIEGHRRYRVVPGDDAYQLQRCEGTEWSPQYIFAKTPRDLADFADMCHFQQHAPDSNFVNRSVCSLATQSGRITLTNTQLITTVRTIKTTADISPADRQQLLSRHFRIDFNGWG